MVDSFDIYNTIRVKHNSAMLFGTLSFQSNMADLRLYFNGLCLGE